MVRPEFMLMGGGCGGLFYCIVKVLNFVKLGDAAQATKFVQIKISIVSYLVPSIN